MILTTIVNYYIIKKNYIIKKSIGGYYPVNNEVDDLEILKEFSKKKYQISLPVIKKNFNMDFYRWSFDDPLKINQYGIPEPNLKKFEKKKYQISLPVIKKNFDMNFYKWSFNDPLKINQYGIPEPHSKKLVYPDVILLPLVAFDNNLNRLGYGGGYYDRVIKKLSKKKKILKIGLAFSVQKINNVPVTKYDKKLDYIVTDKYIL